MQNYIHRKVLSLTYAFVHPGDSLAYQVSIANTDIYKCSFLPDKYHNGLECTSRLSYLFCWRCQDWSCQVHFSGENWGRISLGLVSDCHSDVSPLNNSDSDSDAFGYFLGIINWSLLDKSAQQVSNKNSSDIISRDTMHWTSDGFAYEFIPVE